MLLLASSVESGRFRGGWRLRLMRAVTVRLPGLSLILATRELPYERRPPGNLLLSYKDEPNGPLCSVRTRKGCRKSPFWSCGRGQIDLIRWRFQAFLVESGNSPRNAWSLKISVTSANTPIHFPGCTRQ